MDVAEMLILKCKGYDSNCMSTCGKNSCEYSLSNGERWACMIGNPLDWKFNKISQEKVEAKNITSPNKCMKPLLCPKCNLNDVMYYYLNDNYECRCCGFEWEK